MSSRLPEPFAGVLDSNSLKHVEQIVVMGDEVLPCRVMNIDPEWAPCPGVDLLRSVRL